MFGSLQTKYSYLILRDPQLIDQLGELFDKEIEELKHLMNVQVQYDVEYCETQEKIAELVGLRVQIDGLIRDRKNGGENA